MGFRGLKLTALGNPENLKPQILKPRMGPKPANPKPLGVGGGGGGLFNP